MMWIGLAGYSQETERYTHEWKSYRQGLELFDKEKYTAAFEAFEQAKQQINDPNSAEYEACDYYQALCSVELFNRNAAYELKQFIQHYPESPRVVQVYFQLGRYYYRKKSWEEATEWLSKIDEYDLTATDRHEFFFRKGYAFFRQDSLQPAKRALYELINVPSYYHAPANYYYGHIAYLEGNYETSLQSFKRIESDEKFSVIVPYYITQIYYNQQRYDSLIGYAEPLLERSDIKRQAEIARLVGEAYFGKGEYGKAVPYLEQYVKESKTTDRSDHFQLGFAYYQEEQYDQAIPSLKKVIYAEDSLAQVSNYLIGNAYLSLDNKRSALAAFQQVYPQEFNEDIAQEALFQYAKLSYELAFDPYNKAIEAFILYLEKYPNALRKEQAYDFLINIYLNSKNYRAAIASLEMSHKLDPRLRQVYQQLLYNLGVEQFLNGQFGMAVQTWDQSLEHPEDKSLTAQTAYWKAEAHYNMRQYLRSIDLYSDFLFQPRAILLPQFHDAHYGIGYAYFQAQDYLNAASWFRKLIAYPDADSARVADALIRTGDCYFIRKEYLLSLEFYQRAIDREGKDTDYALYQFALASGILQKDADKLAALTRLEQSFPHSSYLDAALYELGRTNLAVGKMDEALAYFNKVTKDHPNSSFKRKAQVSIGLIYFNQNQNDQALSIFKQVVAENPNYTDSREALRGIRNIYRETGNIDTYESYIAGLDFLNLSNGSLDSLTYESAELRYMAGNCTQSAEDFTAYLEKFDPPIFYLEAHFYLAECLFKQPDLPGALVHYTQVLEKPTSKFTEPALAKAAYINYELHQYDQANTYYQQLLEIARYPVNRQAALLGIMRSEYHEGEFLEALDAAEDVLKSSDNTELETGEAQYIIARSRDALGQDSAALHSYQKLVQEAPSEKAAEALFRIADLYFRQNQLDSAESKVFELVNFTPTQEEWLANGLLLLADVYLAREDDFQAKATLETIIENYEGEERIKTKAQEKLATLLKAQQPTEEKTPEVEIDLRLDSIDYDLLFLEDEEPIEEDLPK